MVMSFHLRTVGQLLWGPFLSSLNREGGRHGAHEVVAALSANLAVKRGKLAKSAGSLQNMSKIPTSGKLATKTAEFPNKKELCQFQCLINS